MDVKNVLNRLRQFDAYPKTIEDFRVKTFGGATGGRYFNILPAEWMLLRRSTHEDNLY